MTSRPLRFAVPLLTVWLLAGCMPLFFPPVPTALVAEPAWRIAPDARLEVIAAAGGRAAALRATFRFTEAAEPGWMSVQWFGPVGPERASDARWVDVRAVGEVIEWDSPPDVPLTRGRWRMVVSIHDQVLRQLDVDVE